MSVLLEILQEMHDDVDFETHQTLIDDRIGVTIPAEELVPENFNSYAAISALVSRLEDED